MKIKALLLSAIVAAALSAPQISADKAVLVNDRGEVLYERNADSASLIASTTKLMTAIVAFENIDMETVVTVPYDACCVEGTRVYLQPGQKIAVKELLEGLLLASGNDAALALSMSIDGGRDRFIELMNEKAVSLGMYSTHFANPHGLDDADHYSTARDLAILMSEFVRMYELREICAKESMTIDSGTFYNHNKLLRMYPDCIAGKTGFTSAAGRCLVSCAERDGERLICVTLSDADDWNDHIKLYEWGFSH